MANTYTQIYIHLIFAIKSRGAAIHPSWANRLYSYIGTVITNKGCTPIQIGGMPDHIHILMGLNPSCTVSDLVKDIKLSSSAWIKDNHLIPCRFYWQEGYGCFSVSASVVQATKAYIANQPQHHLKKGLLDEYMEFLTRYDIDFDSKYIFTEPQ